MAKRLTAFRLDPELLARVDAVRGDVSRTRFVERALESALIRVEPLDDVVARSKGEVVAPRKVERVTVPVKKGPPPLPPGVQRGATTFKCPSPGCNLRAGSPNATCPRHARKVVPA